ncbi:SGNH/GDSL hydrolase family protein [Streptomyces sp. NBC_00239]|uniref:SGNH/GDSL hydrolase family protein n=1 Tax=Streptomyces sp. NBC_00239 TaxID=2903640 RepID=UPI002E2B0320|nr:SGNH/GDSL hydrolase family protein [Streptomyces sp. NBC_00239]
MRARRWLVTAVTAMSLSAGLNGPATPAEQPGPWQRTTPGVSGGPLETDLQSGVSVQGCDGSASAAPAVRRFSSAGATLPGAPTGAMAGCLRTVTGSGLTVGIRPRPRPGNQDPSTVVAYRGAALQWSRTITSTCGSAPLSVGRLVTGADGNVYGAATGHTSCGAQAAVFGLSAATGALLFLNRAADSGELVGAHRRGLVVLNRNGDGVRFLDYGGREYGRVRVTSAASEMPQRLAVNPDGYVFAYVTDRNGTGSRPDCATHYTANRVEVFGVNGRTGRHVLPYCTTLGINAWSAAGWGAPALLSSHRTDVPNTDRLLAFDTKAKQLFSRALPARVTGADGDVRAYAPVAVHADSRGRVLLVRNVSYGGFSSTSLQVDAYSHTSGAPLDSFDTSSFDGGRNGHTQVYGFAEGRLYFQQSVCADADCSAWTPTLFSLPRGGLGMDEPRATLLKSAKALPAPVRTVALGDSYSSGEGNPPFDSASGDCHRGAQAWPRLLAADDPGVQLVAHVACSGAKASAFTQPYHGEPAQVTGRLKAVKPAPGLVTLTIGGNDVGFSGILRRCFLVDCIQDRSLSHANSYVTSTLPGLLRSSYGLVRSTVPRTSRVLVVGYPRLFPLRQSDTTRCLWLSSGERAGLNSLATRLDQAIATAAREAKVSYVSVREVLTGHELCTAQPWVYDVGLHGGANRGHPLPAGQRAIEAAVRRAVAAG